MSKIISKVHALIKNDFDVGLNYLPNFIEITNLILIELYVWMDDVDLFEDSNLVRGTIRCNSNEWYRING